jgi:hypothetical protein
MPSVLAAFKLPRKLVTLDFETYYSADYSLSKLTTEAYVRDLRFEVIGVSVKVDGRPAVWMEEADFRAWAGKVDWTSIVLLAHHAHFDGLILSERYGIRPGFWLDTLSMSRALRGPGRGNDLATLAEAYGVGHKGNEVKDAKGKRRRDFSVAEWLQYGAYSNNDVELAREIYARMRPHLPAAELLLIDTTVRMFTEPSFVADQDVLTRTLDAERKKKRDVLLGVAQSAGVNIPRHLLTSGDAGVDAQIAALLTATAKVLRSDPQFYKLLHAHGVDPGTKRNKKGDQVPALAKTDPGMQSLLEGEDATARALVEARLTVKSTIVETRTERMMAIGRRGRVPFYLKFCGAHTHRWSGGDKMNPQNFNRGGALRNALLAPPGHILVVADSSQIEARKVAWFAGEASVLDTFRRLDALGYDEKGEPRGDFYSERGSVYFSRKITKKTDPVERQTSKSMELGLGFGMGWFAFAGSLLKGFLGAPPVQFTEEHAQKFGVDLYRFEFEPLWRGGPRGLEEVARLAGTGVRLQRPGERALLVHCAVTHHLVRLYRTTNARIAGVWKVMEQLLPIMGEEGDADGVRARFGPLEVVRHGLRKPNGMVLHYPGLRRSKDGDGWVYQGGKSGREVVPVYGGLLTENVVQSLARDVVAEQALWVRAAGHHIGTTTHDEIVAVVPEAQGEKCLADMLRIMRTPPSWCCDLPLNATGAVARTYGDAK